MRDLVFRILGLLFLFIMALFSITNIQKGFKPFEYTIYPIEESLAFSEDQISTRLSYSLWFQRSSDIIFLALLLFVASACCASILSPIDELERMPDK